MKWVFDQVMILDGGRRLRGDIIQKTLKVCTSLKRLPRPYSRLFCVHVCNYVTSTHLGGKCNNLLCIIMVALQAAEFLVKFIMKSRALFEQ